MVGLPLAGRFSPFETDPVPKAALPVRFIGVGSYSLDVEVVAYVTTSDSDEFLGLQQELMFKMLQAVEHAGTALAVPVQESFDRKGLHRHSDPQQHDFNSPSRV